MPRGVCLGLLFLLFPPTRPFFVYFLLPVGGTRGWGSGRWALNLKPVSHAVRMAQAASAAAPLCLLEGSWCRAVVHNHCQVGGRARVTLAPAAPMLVVGLGAGGRPQRLVYPTGLNWLLLKTQLGQAKHLSWDAVHA